MQNNNWVWIIGYNYIPFKVIQWAPYNYYSRDNLKSIEVKATIYIIVIQSNSSVRF